MAFAQQLRDAQTLVLSPRWQNQLLLALKRTVDICGAVFLLVVLSPLLGALACLVKLTSQGPVFYRWRVVGKAGRPFVGYKFRSMVQDADNLKRALLPSNEMVGPVFKLTRDPRVTPFGDWMRRYSL